MNADIRRGIDEEQFTEWMAVPRTAMLGDPFHGDGDEDRRSLLDLDRCTAAFDHRGKLCGTAYAFPTDLTIPGGTIPAAAVTAVGVLPTHRRQGHLEGMMREQLADIAERGEPVAALVAAEYPIYERYGYGPATEACGVEIDTAGLRGRHGGWHDPPTGTTELVDNATFYKVLPDLYDRARRRAPGHLAWGDHDHRVAAGLERPEFGPDTSRSPRVVWRDTQGAVQGAAVYRLSQNWQGNRPLGRLTAALLIAATDEAEREVTRYLTQVDWIATVRLDMRPVDDATPLRLLDGRLAQLVDRSDHMWVRLLDVPAALSARRYHTHGKLVIEVDDPTDFATGRFLLETGDVGDGGGEGDAPATCVPTRAEPDLAVRAPALGAAYLGGFSWSRLAAAGWVDERRSGAVDLASAMFTTPRAPWCAMTF